MRWTDTDTRPIPIEPRRLTAGEVERIERGETDFYQLTGQERPKRIVPQPRPWPKATAPGAGRRRTGEPLAFGRALDQPSRAARFAVWCDLHSLWLLVIVTALCVGAVLLWGV
ncbi:MAG TPA: hypothetical protein VKU87_04370 [Thermomicrobiaceae bacterium]|nr:hypothetical protein [Thermomicrobiaceae bacterium]